MNEILGANEGVLPPQGDRLMQALCCECSLKNGPLRLGLCSPPLAPADVANTRSPSNPKEGFGKPGAAYDTKHEFNKKERQNMRKRKPDSAVSIKRFFQSQAFKS